MRRRIVPLAAVLTAGFLGEFAFALLLLPLLQRYLPAERGLSVELPGYILSAYGFSRLAVQLPLGAVADVIDRRLAVTLGYLAVLAAGLAFWPPVPVVVLLLAGGVFGLGHALADPLVPAGLAEGTVVRERGRIFALFNLVQVAGLAVGAAGGAFIADLTPAAVGFLLVAGANALTLVLLAGLAAPLLRGGRRARQSARRLPHWQALLDERVVYLLGALFVLALTVNLLTPDIELFAVRRLHSSLHVLTLYLLPAALVGTVALPFGGWLADRLGRLPPLLAGAAGGAIALALFARLNAPWQAAIVAVFAVAGLALTMPPSNAALLDIADPDHRALLFSGMMAVQGLAQAVGPFLSGVLIFAGGAAAPFVAAAVSLWLAIPCTVLYASSPQDGDEGAVVDYTPLTRFVSRAHIRAHARRDRRQTPPSGVTGAAAGQRKKDEAG